MVTTGSSYYIYLLSGEPDQATYRIGQPTASLPATVWAPTRKLDRYLVNLNFVIYILANRNQESQYIYIYIYYVFEPGSMFYQGMRRVLSFDKLGGQPRQPSGLLSRGEGAGAVPSSMEI